MLAILHLRCPQKLLLQSLSSRLDVYKRESSFLLLVVAPFLSRIYLREKANLFLWQNDNSLIQTEETQQSSVQIIRF